MTTSPEPEPPAAFTRQDVFAVLGALGAIITLAAAVMYYFGWRRSHAQAQAMSIDVSLFGFTSQDYVLRSTSSLYLPMLVIVLLGLVWVWAHLRFTRLLRSDRLRNETSRARLLLVTRIAFVVGVTGAAAAIAVSVLADERWAPWPVRPTARALATREWVLPLVLILGTLLATYAVWVRRQLGDGDRREGTQALWRSALPVALVGATVLLSGFWLLEEYAASVGRDLAGDLTAGVHRLPRAVVTSPTPLGIEAPNVHEELASAASELPRYRTTGLRLLSRSAGKVLLVHDDWTPSSGTVIVLADGDELVWEFFR